MSQISIAKAELMIQKGPNTDLPEILGKINRIADHVIQIRLETGNSLVFPIQIARELKVDYNTFSNLFLFEYGFTLESVFQMRVIEKVKELLVYTEQSLKQIAKPLGYNNPSSLSYLLKKYTGFTAAYFKQIRKNKLKIIRRQQEEQSKNLLSA